MRKITREVVGAFMHRGPKRNGNTISTGKCLFLHHNKIAEWRDDGSLWITSGGWETNTTKERLNGIPFVSILQVKRRWLLNGMPWSGEWIRVL